MKKIYKILLVCGLLLLIIGFIFMFLNKKQSKPLIKVTDDISKKLKDDSYKLLGYFIEDRYVNFSNMSNEEKTAAVVYISLPNYKESKIQKEYNAYNHIDPKSIVKEIAEDLINLDYGIEEKKFENNKKVFRNKADIEKEITKLEKKIKKLVEELDFEQAIVLRDEMLKLKELLLEF